MGSPSGASTGSSSVQSEGNPDDTRKRKRMLSNRESARRSRMRKQKHLDELMSQVTNLRAENSQVLTNIGVVSQMFVNVESENFVLRAQMSELSHRLVALHDIIECLCSNDVMISPSPKAFENAAVNFGDQVDDEILGWFYE